MITIIIFTIFSLLIIDDNYGRPRSTQQRPNRWLLNLKRKNMAPIFGSQRAIKVEPLDFL